jgi:parallel beta-helix repeat protein
VKITTADPMPTTLPLPAPILIGENGAIEGAEGALQCNGNTYIFVRDIDRTIVVQKNNIVIDGNGFNLTKPPEVDTSGFRGVNGFLSSITIENSSNVVIKNINFNKCFNAISISDSLNITVFNNTISESSNTGIYIHISANCQISGNKITDNSYAGLDIWNSSFLNISYNRFTGNDLKMNWNGVSYSNVSRNDFISNSFSCSSVGLEIYGLNCYNRIFENNFIGNEYGLHYYLGYNSHDNQVYNNFWNNAKNIVIESPENSNWTDQAPLTNPMPIVFEPPLFSLPTFEPETSGESQSSTTEIIVGVAIASIVITAVSLLLYRHKHVKLAQKPQTPKLLKEKSKLGN